MLAHYYAATLAVMLGSAAVEVLDGDERISRRRPITVGAAAVSRGVPAPLRILRVKAGVLRDLLRRTR